jgi:glucan 1,3-beta-glucosidase
MSRPLTTGDDIAYDPIPNPQEPSDVHESPYDPPVAQSMSDPPMDDLNPEELSVNLVRPRFLGSVDDGEGLRESMASYGSGAPSEGVASLYALNPGIDSLSTRGSRPFSAPYRDEPHSLSDDAFDGPPVPLSSLSPQPRFLTEKQAAYAPRGSKSRSRRNVIILSAVGGLILLIVAVVLPVYFLAIKHKSQGAAAQHSQSTSAASSPSATSTPSKSGSITGSDGSTVTMEDGTTFVYSNSFGGFWYDNKDDPFNECAQSQSWSPPLNATFKPGGDRIRGYVTCSHTFYVKVNFRNVLSVNLGGWLVPEPVSSHPVIPAMAGPSHSFIVHNSRSLPKISNRSR